MTFRTKGERGDQRSFMVPFAYRGAARYVSMN